jgi:hypothetical protein
MQNFRIPIAGAEPGASAWHAANQNHVWSGRQVAGAPRFDVVERLPEGIVRLPERERVFHIIPAGRPYRVEHAFGFWRTCGADTLYIRSPYEGGSVATLIVSTANRTYRSDRLAWTCPACGRELRALEVPTRRVRLAGLLARALADVRAFNSDAAARTCSDCGAVHPISYGFESASDNDEERAARADW